MAGIAENIKRLRIKNGWSQQELADKINKTRTAIYQYETGKNTPRMGVVEDLARVFGVPKSELVESTHLDFAANADEQQLLSIYRSLPASGKRAVMAAMRELAQG